MSLNKFVIVNTEHGPVKGDRRTSLLGVDYFNFQGIPYMRAPVGKLRFRAPVEPQKWTEPFDCTKNCPTFPTLDFKTYKFVGVDDAGCVNVFTKDTKPNSLYPVLVYIHGGGFQLGSSSTLSCGPEYLLQKELIVVSFNYRCGAFGFLSLDDPSLDVPGNSGLKDQRMALKWIRDNIKNFGGDPNNVTVFGTSAGGASVYYHLISEASRGLFHRAIAMSGSGLNYSWAHHPRRDYAARLAKRCGFEGDEKDEKSILEFLETVDCVKLAEISGVILTDEEKYQEHAVFTMGPVIEPYTTAHTFIDRDLILMSRDAWSRDIDVIYGATSNEGLLMAFMADNDDERLRYLDDPVNFVPLLDLKINRNDPRAEEFGKRLKELYYGVNRPSETNKLPYYYYHSDLQFLHGIQRAIWSRVSVGGRGKTFTYYFDILTSQNGLRKILKCDHYPGTEHGGCMGYIFTGQIFPIPAIDSIEFRNILKVIGIIGNFAIHGHTGVDEWEANESLELPLRCLQLTKDGMQMIDLPESARLKVWNEIYDDAGVALY